MDQALQAGHRQKAASWRSMAALEHPAFKWSHLKADKMRDIQRSRAPDNPKTAHTFGSDALDQMGRLPRVCLFGRPPG
jgi:hypothetical protein